MTARPSSKALPWAWTIEALASYNEVDVTTLIDAFKRSPEISSEFGSNAREMASLRILERLFDQDTASNSGVGFDSAERCEDVLRRILGEMRLPTTWDESEKSKWNAQPFIAYKRSCLFKCDLQLLKDTLIEGKLSHLASLKQRVTSLHQNQLGFRIPDVIDARLDTQRWGSCADDEVCQDKSNEKNGDMSKRTRTLNGESESSSDNERYQEEMNDIAAKKQAFVRTKCTDREVAVHRNESNCCMKCQKVGQLLVCSTESCSFVFHDSCLASEPSFDGDSTRKYYCPFCIYSRAISEYRVAKQKSSLARNDLVFFSNALKEDEVVDEKIEKSKNKESDNVIRVISGSSSLESPDSCNESSENSGTKGCYEGSLERADGMDRSVRFKKQIKPCTYLRVPQTRRVPVPWTQLEEETLKKWVNKFSSGASSIHGRGVPWRKILDLGASVFQRSRKPGDLKDKWRNLQKANTNLT